MEIALGITGIAASVAAQREVERLREAVGIAEDTFRHYGTYHAARGNKDKAESNHALADRMAAAMAGSPDPRDARIAELEAALRVAKINGISLYNTAWNAGQNGSNAYRIAAQSYKKKFEADIDAALKEATHE